MVFLCFFSYSERISSSSATKRPALLTFCCLLCSSGIWCWTSGAQRVFVEGFFFSSPFYTTACCGQLAALRERWEGEPEQRSLGPSGRTMSWNPLWGSVRRRGAADTGESLAVRFITLSDAVYIIVQLWCCHTRQYKSTTQWFFWF